MHRMQTELVWDCGCQLGEGALWNAADASLYFVDIHGREVLAFTPATGAKRRWAVPQKIGWIVPRSNGGWIAGFQQGIAALTLEPHVAVEWLHVLHEADTPMRLNDAKADAAGRLWFGSMHVDEVEPVGRFYRWVHGSAPAVVDEGYVVTNGPAFSPDGRTLYHTDSAAATIYAFDLSADSALSRKRSFAEFGPYQGYPDGMATDVAGHVWVAHWAGSRVTERDAAGHVLKTLVVPAPHVTNAAFGGPALTDLYITTARHKLTDSALAQSPLSGGLFVARGVGPGRPPGVFAG